LAYCKGRYFTDQFRSNEQHSFKTKGTKMPKVKLLITTSGVSYDEYDSYSADIIRAGLTDWEEITDQEYEYLKSKKYYLGQALKLRSGEEIVIMKQDDRPVVERISSLTTFIKKLEDERAKEEAARLKKKEDAALTRKLKKQAKTEAEELALLQQLKEKHEK